MPANNPTAYQDPAQQQQGQGEYQEDPYGGDPIQHKIKEIMADLAQKQYGKELGALTREEFEPILNFIKENRAEIKQHLEGALVGAGGGLAGTGKSIGGAVFSGAKQGVNAIRGALDRAVN